jgi:hypothetical protein
LAGRNQPRTQEEDQIGMKVLKWTQQYQDQAAMFKKSFMTQTNANIDFVTCEKNWLAMGEMGVILFNVAMTPISPISHVELHCRHQSNLQTDFTETSIEINLSIETLKT